MILLPNLTTLAAMANEIPFFVAFPGELTPEDQSALEARGFEVFRNAVGVPKPFWEKEGGPRQAANYQVVRVFTETPEEAERQVVDALGHEPPGLQVGS